MKVGRAYGYTPSEVYEMDFLLFSIALADLATYPLIDEAFYRAFCEPTKMTIPQKRAAAARSR